VTLVAADGRAAVCTLCTKRLADHDHDITNLLTKTGKLHATPCCLLQQSYSRLSPSPSAEAKSITLTLASGKAFENASATSLPYQRTTHDLHAGFFDGPSDELNVFSAVRVVLMVAN
jgi:hypothetical protein